MASWLLVDANFLCYRALHTTGQLSHEGEATGIAYGFLRDLKTLGDLYYPDTMVFAFDSKGLGIRGEMYPNYKSTRRNKVRTEEEQDAFLLFLSQVKKLQYDILPRLGYNNVFATGGYEADDIIAYFAEELPVGDDAVIVSADQDLWQCITDNVVCYNPISKKVTSAKSFREKWGIDPSMWASVKAFAGCKTDDIEGVKGIGEVSACKWFNKTLKEGSKKYKAINDNLAIHNRNIKLTRLPLPDVGKYLSKIQPDEATDAKLHKIEVKLGFNTRRQAKTKYQGFDL